MEELRVLKKEDIFSLSCEKEFKIGVEIKGHYTDRLPIHQIHSAVRNIFSHFINNRDSIVKENMILSKKSDQRPQDRELRDYNIAMMNKCTQKNWTNYCNNVKDLLNKYSELTDSKTSPQGLRIGTKKTILKSNDITKTLQRIDIIKQYLNYASNYIEMDLLFVPPFKIGCDTCNTSIDEMEIDEDDGVYTCKCNTIFGSVYSLETSHADPDKIEFNSKNTYDDRTNFIRRLKSYQGFQIRKLSPEFINFLDKHLQDKYRHPPAAVTRLLKADKYGHKGEYTSVALLIDVLSETENSIHFSDINNICYELWGWECPKIDHLISKIMDDYIRTQEVYKRLVPSGSSINVELRLYWHLIIAGYNCPIEDFKIPQGRGSKKRNSEIFKQMCEETGLPFYPII